MKRPSWITAVGIIAIILGVLGIMGGAGNMLTPTVIELQQEMFSSMQEMMENEPDAPVGLFRVFERFLDMPPWVGTWYVVTGVLKLLASGFVILAAAYLLQVKKQAPLLFYAACGSRLLVAVLELVPVFSGSLWGYSTLSNAFLGIVAFGALLLVAATSDKRAFAPSAPAPQTEN